VRSLLCRHCFRSDVIDPVIAGADPVGNVPFIATSESIGAFSKGDNFVVAGRSSETLLGLCESVSRPGINPDELFHRTAKCLLASVERDSLAGWSGIAHLITPDQDFEAV
jgi:20S proteasome subunit beta 3